MPTYNFYQSSPIKLPTFCSSSSCLWQVFLSWFHLCGYHGYCWAYLAHIYILYQTQVQSFRNVVVVVVIAHVLTGNGQKNGAVFNYIIGSSVIVDADLRTALLFWVALSSHHFTVTSISAGGVIGHVLKPYLSVVGWMNFWVVARMDTTIGNMKVY